MKTITASKLRVEFASIIKDLDAGPVHITKHGKTIAVLTSPNAAVETPEEPVSMTTTPRAPEPSQSDLDAYDDEYEEDDFEADDWDMSMDSDFENYLSKMMSHAIDRPRP